MTKTITSQEVIWDNKTIKWTEKINTISPDTIDIPDYSYGNWQETLDAEIALRNNASWASVKVLYFTKTDNTTSIDTYEWFWFTPTSYIIQAWLNINNDYWANSYGSYIWDATSMFYMRIREAAEVESDYNTWQYTNTSNLIQIYNDTTDGSYASHDSFTADWIKLDWGLADVDVKFTITAYA
jgi:hypothetical protein